MTTTALNSSQVRVDLLGGFRMRVGASEMSVSEVAQRVIAFVALTNRPIRRERIAGSLWPEKTDDRAGANLRSALWRLRQQGADVLMLEGSTLCLRSDVSVDVHDVTAWAWRVIENRPAPGDIDQFPPSGELLADWYDEWVVIERERLHQLRLHAIEGICRCLLDHGRVARAIDASLAVVSVDPLRESAHRLLIEAHVAEGNWAEAVRAGQRYASTMREQLGLDVADRLQNMLPGVLAAKV